MKYSGETSCNEHGLCLLTWDKCGIFKDNEEPLDGIAEANLRIKAGGLAVLEVKIFNTEAIDVLNRKIGECPFPKKAIVRKEKINDIFVDVYEFAVISFNIETKEDLAFLESHV